MFSSVVDEQMGFREKILLHGGEFFSNTLFLAKLRNANKQRLLRNVFDNLGEFINLDNASMVPLPQRERFVSHFPRNTEEIKRTFIKTTNN